MTLKEHIENAINDTIDNLMESDDFYEAKSNPLKPASSIKAAHRHELEESFKLKDFHEKMSDAISLIINNDIFSKEEKELIDRDFFEKVAQIDEEKLESLPEINIIPQKELDISDECMNLIYNLGSKLFEENKSSDSLSIFTLLGFLNPSCVGYWIGLMMANFQLEKFYECNEMSKIVTALDPEQTIGFIYAILAKRQLEEECSIDEELSKIFDIFETHPEEKERWENYMHNF